VCCNVGSLKCSSIKASIAFQCSLMQHWQWILRPSAAVTGYGKRLQRKENLVRKYLTWVSQYGVAHNKTQSIHRQAKGTFDDFFWPSRLRQVGAARSTALRPTWASSRRQSRGAFRLVEGVHSVGVELDHAMVRTSQNYHGGQNRSAWSCRCSTTPGGIRPGGLPRWLESVTKLAAILDLGVIAVGANASTWPGETSFSAAKTTDLPKFTWASNGQYPPGGFRYRWPVRDQVDQGGPRWLF